MVHNAEMGRKKWEAERRSFQIIGVTNDYIYIHYN